MGSMKACSAIGWNVVQDTEEIGMLVELMWATEAEGDASGLRF
jgi:hypothetical protein